MSYEDHIKLYEELCAEWHRKNYKSPEVRKALKYIDSQKKRRGVL